MRSGGFFRGQIGSSFESFFSLFSVGKAFSTFEVLWAPDVMWSSIVAGESFANVRLKCVKDSEILKALRFL